MRFGQIELDSARGGLKVGGRPVELDRSCRTILALLLNERGDDVHKDRLLEAGWPGRTVDENSLAKAIGRLRRALGADGEAIRTVHGFGYRLDAEVPKPPRAPAARRRFQRPALAASAVALAAFAALAVALSGRTRSGAEAPLVKGEPANSIGRLLWVDDHPQNNTNERRALEARRITVYQVKSSEEALALLAMYDYGAVISDMNRGETPLAGLELVREMRSRRDATPFIVYTVVPSGAQRRLVAEAGGQRAVATPAELYDAVAPLFETRGARPTS